MINYSNPNKFEILADKMGINPKIANYYRESLQHKPVPPFLVSPDGIKQIFDDKQEQLLLPKNIFGLPVFNTVYLEVINNNYVIDKKINLECCFVKVNQVKNMVKTPINGYRGTVKEILSIYDYDITLTGMIAGDKVESYLHKDPETLEDQLETLSWLCNYAGDLTIYNQYLQDYFNVNIVSVNDSTFEQSPNYSNIVFFTINACDSDIYPIAY